MSFSAPFVFNHFRTLLQEPIRQLLCNHILPHSLAKTPGVGTPLRIFLFFSTTCPLLPRTVCVRGLPRLPRSSRGAEYGRGLTTSPFSVRSVLSVVNSCSALLFPPIFCRPRPVGTPLRPFSTGFSGDLRSVPRCLCGTPNARLYFSRRAVRDSQAVLRSTP